MGQEEKTLNSLRCNDQSAIRMKQFRVYNLTIGWSVFVIASVVYLLTIEPTTSLWDCGEFIASAFKLEVGHPPGAPFWMIMARVMSLFAGSDVSQAAKMINALSALASSFTVLFLFWTITHLARKLLIKNDSYSTGTLMAVMASGVVGALAYTFSDTFWFSAVEGEVYATSSLFTAIVFWAILRWENVAEERYADRWLILIAYLMGLSIGVHLLNLLAIPAIVFVYYFRKYTPTKQGFVFAFLVSVVILGVIMYGIIPGIVKTSSRFELFFINTLGLPYHSGLLIHIILLMATIGTGIYFTRRKGNPIYTAASSTIALILLGIPFISDATILNLLLLVVLAGVVYYLSTKQSIVLNTIITAALVILIGYSSFTMIMIRSAANPPMDENNPETVFSLLYYLNREQYGDRPLLYGQYYNAPIVDVEEGNPTYTQQDGKYVVSRYASKYLYDERLLTFFPRMWSGQPDHRRIYEQWGKVDGKRINIQNSRGEETFVEKPTFGQNLRFFFTYQVGHMYLRYFMWNFAGRQNDEQGHGGPLKGNWISGINFLDSAKIGNQDNLPDHIANDKSRNVYYLLPFILGLAGFLYHLQRNRKDFWVVLLLFLFTGLAIVVYLNQYPNQPRERDYAYAGSFYAYAIWIGLGVLSLFDAFSKAMGKKGSAILAGLLCLFLVPGIMAKENWDDHDRSGRFTARDIAYNYLNSCAPNAILFTNGDNDTFPLWYAQEVEGIRTDIRVVNLMLFNTDWYIDQMKRKAYESEPLPLSVPREKYKDGTNGQVFMIERVKEYIPVKQVIDFVVSDDEGTKIRYEDELLDYIPTKMFRIPVDSAEVVENGTIAPELADQIVNSIDIKINRNYLLKNQLMVLDLLAQNNWERPIYFVTGGHDDALGLEEYFQLEGFAYRLVPVKTEGATGFLEMGRINADAMYENLMNNFKWGRMNEPDVYLDFYNKRTFSVIKIRNNFTRLAEALVNQGKRDSAVAVLDRCMELMPQERIPYDIFTVGIAETYYQCAETEKANTIMDQYAAVCEEELNYYFSLRPSIGNAIDYEKRLNLQIFQELVRLTQRYGQLDRATRFEETFNDLYNRYVGSSPR